MKYLLDTDMCSYISRGRPSGVRERFESLAVGDLGMSCITYGELAFGCRLHTSRAELLTKLARLIELIPVLPVTEPVAQHYGQIRSHLQAKGNLIGPNDLWIAAQARSESITLVTNNTREFKRVPGLKVENWSD